MSIPLYEKYRPQTLDEVIGQPRAVATIRTLAARDAIAGHAFWFSGKTGQGKTTLAYLLAGLVADRFFWLETTGRRLTPSTLDQWAHIGRLCALGKGGRAFIVNEAHGLKAPAIEMLLDWLEPPPAHAVVIFTTTRDGQDLLFEDQIDARPLLHRCQVIPLVSQGFNKAAAQRAREIADLEQLNGQPLENYLKVANKHNGSLRALLEDVEAGKMQESPS